MAEKVGRFEVLPAADWTGCGRPRSMSAVDESELYSMSKPSFPPSNLSPRTKRLLTLRLGNSLTFHGLTSSESESPEYASSIRKYHYPRITSPDRSPLRTIKEDEAEEVVPDRFRLTRHGSLMQAWRPRASMSAIGALTVGAKNGLLPLGNGKFNMPITNLPELSKLSGSLATTFVEPARATGAGFYRARMSRRKQCRRLVMKNGECNVSHENVPKQRQRYMRDIFTTLIDVKWRWCLMCFGAAFLTSWTLFAVIYYLICFIHGDFTAEHNTPNRTWTPCISQVHGFTSIFLFSIESQHTIGYGHRFITEACPSAIFTLCFQSICGVMIQSFMAGVVFAKIARPKKRAETLIFSKNAVICVRDGQLCFLFRVGDMRKSHIVEAHVRLQLIKKRVTQEVEFLPLHQYDMDVGYDEGLDRIFLVWPLTICHVIDEDSPLYEYSAEDMITAQFEIVAILEGIVESTGMTTQARTSYLPHEVLWGYRFEKLVSYDSENGTYKCDYERFHKTIPMNTPMCSAKDLDDLREAGYDIAKEHGDIKEGGSCRSSCSEGDKAIMNTTSLLGSDLLHRVAHSTSLDGLNRSSHLRKADSLDSALPSSKEPLIPPLYYARSNVGSPESPRASLVNISHQPSQSTEYTILAIDDETSVAQVPSESDTTSFPQSVSSPTSLTPPEIRVDGVEVLPTVREDDGDSGAYNNGGLNISREGQSNRDGIQCHSSRLHSTSSAEGNPEIPRRRRVSIDEPQTNSTSNHIAMHTYMRNPGQFVSNRKGLNIHEQMLNKRSYGGMTVSRQKSTPERRMSECRPSRLREQDIM